MQNQSEDCRRGSADLQEHIWFFIADFSIAALALTNCQDLGDKAGLLAPPKEKIVGCDNIMFCFVLGLTRDYNAIDTQDLGLLPD